MSSSNCMDWREDILESLDELICTPIQDIYSRMIQNSSPMESHEETHYHQQQQQMEHDTAASVTSLRQAQFATSSLQKRLDSNSAMDKHTAFDLGNKEQRAMYWIKHMHRTIRDTSVVGDDFYDQFIGRYRTMRKLPSLIWVRPNTVSDLPWQKGHKTRFLPMVKIPRRADIGINVTPASLIAQDTLYLCPEKKKMLLDLHQQCQSISTDTEKVILPSRQLKSIHCVPRLATTTKLCKEITSQTQAPCTQVVDDDLKDGTTTPSDSNSSNSIKSKDNTNTKINDRYALPYILDGAIGSSVTSYLNYSFKMPYVKSARSTLHESSSPPPSPPSPPTSTLTLPKKRIATTPKHSEQQQQQPQHQHQQQTINQEHHESKEQDKQNGQTTIVRIGTSRYWPSSGNSELAHKRKTSSPSSRYNDSSVVSLSHSLFDSNKDPSSLPCATKISEQPVSLTLSSPSRKTTSTKRPSTESDDLSLDSLSINGDHSNTPAKTNTRPRRISSTVNEVLRTLDVFSPPEEELASILVSMKHDHQAAARSPKKLTYFDNTNRYTVNSLGKNQVAPRSPVMSPMVRNGEDQQAQVTSSSKPSLFSPGNSLNDFLAIRRPTPQHVGIYGFGRGSSSKSTSLKRRICELDDLDHRYPEKKKETWKLSTIHAGKISYP